MVSTMRVLMGGERGGLNEIVTFVLTYAFYSRNIT